MIKRNLFPVIATICLITGTASAQDPIFTQFYANPIYLNPAFAGSARCWRMNLNFRNQWAGIEGTYVTYSASVDKHVDAIQGGLALIATNDNAGNGILKTTNASGIYSYLFQPKRYLSIRVGFQATFFQKSIDWSRLTFGDMIDERRGFVYDTQEKSRLVSKSNVDFSGGVLAYTKMFYAGVAVHHITQPNEGLLGDSKLPMKLTAHAGALIPVGEKGNLTSISPNIIYQQQQNFTHLNLGLYVNKGPLVAGMWFRYADAFIMLVGFQHNSIKIGYSYDVTISKIRNVTYGSHEISFSKQFQCKPRIKKFRGDSCPSF